MRAHRAETRAAAAFTVVLAILAAVGGCDRTPRLVKRPDSTAVVVDSSDILVRDAGRAWEGGAPDDAAALTARVLHVDLRHRRPDTWQKRAQSLLDSMNVGAEITSDPCVMVVNMFSRGDPNGPSWPYVFWCDADSVRHQAMEGQGMRLMQVMAREIKGDLPSRGLAVLYGLHGGAGSQPVLLVWRASGNGGWTLTQTLGPDSLGGTGTGQLERTDDGADLAVKTFNVTNGFVECASCPHLEVERHFHWDGNQFVKTEEHVDPTPYATFVQFIQDVRASDYVAAVGHVADRSVLEWAIHLGWAHSNAAWRAAPGTRENAREMVFLLGQQEAYRVWFEPRGDTWMISSVDTTARVLDE